MVYLFAKKKTYFDVECALIEKEGVDVGLLTYPFSEGLLLSINYLDEYKYPTDPTCRYFQYGFSGRIKKSLTELLKIVKNLSHILSFSNAK